MRRDTFEKDILTKIIVEGLDSDLHLDRKTGKPVEQCGDLISQKIMALKMDDADTPILTDGLKIIECVIIKLENRSAVYDLQLAVETGEPVDHASVKFIVGVFVGTLVDMIVAKGTPLIEAPLSAQKNDLAGILVPDNAVAFHNMSP